jgi:manganese transport protein
MLPLLMMTDSKVEMGSFKNAMWLKVLGWVSVLGLIYLNMIGLPGSVQGFFGDNPTGSQLALANGIAYVLIAGVLALLIWTTVELYRGNKRFAAAQANGEVEQKF